MRHTLLLVGALATAMTVYYVASPSDGGAPRAAAVPPFPGAAAERARETGADAPPPSAATPAALPAPAGPFAATSPSPPLPASQAPRENAKKWPATGSRRGDRAGGATPRGHGVAATATTASSPARPSWTGGPCARDADCAAPGARCLLGPEHPGGYCTAACRETCADRAGETITFCASEESDLGDGAAACVARCDYDRYPGASAGCREGYECALASRAGDDDTRESVCLPASAGPARGAARLRWQRYPGGRQARVTLRTAPFPHESRRNGLQVGRRFYSRARHFSDSSALLLVPRRFRDKGNLDLVVHFHGFNGDIQRLVKTKELRKQFFASRRNAVLVLVQGPKSVPDAHPGKVGDPGGFRNLVTEVLELLHGDGLIAQRRLGQVALTSHSGGYRAVAAALEERRLGRRIVEVYLFDSFYGKYGAFYDYVTRTKGRFVSLVTAELASANAKFKGWLRDAGLPYGTDLREDERLTFLRSHRSHADAPRCGNLQRFLETANIEEHPYDPPARRAGGAAVAGR